MKKGNGFTLLEMIIAMAIITIAMGVVFMAFSLALRLFVEEATRTDVYIEADRGMSKMVQELRGAKQIINASSREVTFWLTDVNDNGTREAEETATFSWSGSPESSLDRIISSETIPIAYGVHDFNLQYDNPSDIKLISIKLTIGEGTALATLESSIKLRNI